MWLWFRPTAANLIGALLIVLSLQWSAAADHDVARVDVTATAQAVERAWRQERHGVRLDHAHLVVDRHFELAFEQIDRFLVVVGVRLVWAIARLDDRYVHREDLGDVVRPDERHREAVVARALACVVPGKDTGISSRV